MGVQHNTIQYNTIQYNRRSRTIPGHELVETAYMYAYDTQPDFSFHAVLGDGEVHILRRDDFVCQSAVRNFNLGTLNLKLYE